jgi:predicted nuclease of predicted toxin-antitoxin system
VKILLDMNLTPKWRHCLQEAGHEVTHLSDIGPTEAPDTVLMEWARQNGYIVFTNDLDYGALLHATGATAPSVIQARSADVRPAALAGPVLQVLQETERELLAGALITIDMRRYRISVLPLRH